MESSGWKRVMELEKYQNVFVVGRKIHVLTEVERREKR